ncbi:SHOCT domain-containing protein [Gramella sp. KN1008]|uniref:SHOCT domain-containing protein n=1 Tax=Gramella sp. KN1008 TaxID=2529298 RepID=UPI00103EB402|nr:SHOCT domain-containing protein [Gramella sp. KN1008]TBW30007.1 hypothetical protein EZJ28_00970 [Gramella sp. KN1008]
MKVSQILMIIMLTVIGITILFFIKNENRAKSIIEDLKNGQIPINDLRDYKDEKDLGVSPFAFGANHILSVEIVRKEKNNKILQRGGGFFVVILVVFMLVRSNENKKDPTKNLEKLRQKNIISESEYQAKIQYAKNLGLEKRAKQIKEREIKKLVSELDSLKAKGIISEDEYQQKLIKVREKTA